MKEYKGIGINNNIGVGKILIVGNGNSVPEKSYIEDVNEELAILDLAIGKAAEQLRIISKEVDNNSVGILEIIDAQLMILKDEEFLNSVRSLIETEKVTSAYAVYTVSRIYEDAILNIDDEYLKERASDLRDVSGRLIQILSEKEEISGEENEEIILVAHELFPSDIFKYKKAKLRGFVTVKGSAISHTSIIANTMEIPAIIVSTLDINELRDGQRAIINAEANEFIINPDSSNLDKAMASTNNRKQNEEKLAELINLPSITKSNKQMDVCANIGSIEDAIEALNNGADGIGLFRSELLFVGNELAPTEDEQFEIYKKVVELFKGKGVTIRTLDIDSDKQLPYLNIPKEDNSALGHRGIRVCLENKDIFKTQLCALFRAATYGDLRILYPMITSCTEMDEIKEIVSEVIENLKDRGIEYQIPRQGIMIETPAAALISEELSSKADFFSIGTNDLTQFTLAVGRQNTGLEKYYDSHHPAVMELIKMVMHHASKSKIPVSVCGDLGEDASLTEFFIDLGISELSVPPASVLRIRKCVRNAM